MIERKLSKLSGEVTRASIFLTRNLSSSITLERSLEKKSLDLKRKIVEDRGRILRRIASRDRDSQRGGLLGGALGLLGIGGGGSLLRRGLRRTPRSPSQLLRMQRGTSSLSRVGRLGRLARPLAAVGTGLDFIGRKAEGQTNVQAGVGAAGGLAGSIAGAKTGALIGTAIAGPLGTAVGGVGGAIIGSLAGGRIADLFTGANRRRRFEEQRTIVRTQKTLFSDALDDFDKVLDKFEDVSPALVLRRDDDEPEEKKGLRRPKPKLPSPAIPFFQRPAVKTTGRVLLATGLLALLAFQLRKGKIDVKTYQRILMLVRKKPASFQKLPLEKQLRILQKEVKVINKTNRKINPEDGRFFARRSIKQKNKNIQEKLRKEQDQNLNKEFQTTSEFTLDKFLKVNKLKDPFKLRSQATDKFSTDMRDVNILKDRGSISQAQADMAINQLKANLNTTLRRIGDYANAIQDFVKKNPNFNPKTDSGKLNNVLKKLDLFNKKKNLPEIDLDKIIIENLKPKIQNELKEILNRPADFDLVQNDLQPPDSTNLALAPIGNVFIINNQEPSDQINVMGGNNNIAMIGNTENSFTSLNKYAEFTSVAFTT
tara:strand:+ start:7759 stop:9546 length:1788 start_codon:yes stop_codon:yes gene_type:complete